MYFIYMFKIGTLTYVDGRPGKVINIHPQKNTYEIQFDSSKSIIEYSEEKVKRRFLHCKNCNRKLKGKPADNLCKSCRR